jgi:predicted nucleic acid-binding protein
MGQMKIPADSKIMLDTAPIIYYILEMISVTPDIGEQSSIFRAKYNLRTPDAIQAAVAKLSESSFLITNDKTFGRIADINVIILDDLLESKPT